MVVTQEDLLSVSSSFSRIIKRGVGKGPEACYAVLKENRLYVHIRNFMTPAEEILTQKKETNLVMKYRTSVISALSKEFLQEASQLLGISFESFYQDWNFHKNTGILLLVDEHYNPDMKLDECLEKTLFQSIRFVGSKLHKNPNELKIIKYTQNTCVVELSGVMLPLEYLLLDQGNADLLLTHAGQMKQGYIQHRALFEDAFNASIEEFFMMWDPKRNKSYLLFSFTKF